MGRLRELQRLRRLRLLRLLGAAGASVDAFTLGAFTLGRRAARRRRLEDTTGRCLCGKRFRAWASASEPRTTQSVSAGQTAMQ